VVHDYEKLIQKFAEAYNENKASMLCGMALMSGYPIAFTMYKTMTH
jgi:hypothetical protein